MERLDQLGGQWRGNHGRDGRINEGRDKNHSCLVFSEKILNDEVDLCEHDEGDMMFFEGGDDIKRRRGKIVLYILILIFITRKVV